MREASTRNVDVYVASVRDQLRSVLWEAQAQLTAEVHQQKWYYNRKNRCCEFETWQPGTSEGGCLEGKEEDYG